MPGAVKTYSAAQVTVIWAGIIISEVGDDEFLRIKRNKPAFELKMSADGYGVREQSTDESAQIEIVLSQTSPVNMYLTAIHAADKAGTRSRGIGPFVVRDNNSQFELHTAAEAWIREEPPVSFARGVKERVWMLETDQMVSVHAGHSAFRLPAIGI